MPSDLPDLTDTLAYAATEIDDDIAGDTSAALPARGFGTTPRCRNGRQVVYTDGACTNNQDDRFRRAGFGLFWCDGDSRNMSGPLPGHRQTNQRAELHAVLVVLQLATGDVDIHTDSAYVHDGCQEYLQSWKSSGWKVDNADLWRQVDDHLKTRRPDSVTFTKVKRACDGRRRGARHHFEDRSSGKPWC